MVFSSAFTVFQLRAQIEQKEAIINPLEIPFGQLVGCLFGLLSGILLSKKTIGNQYN